MTEERSARIKKRGRPYDQRTHSSRRARPPGAPVQELPTAYKSVCLYCLPLRGRRAESSRPTNAERTIAVGRVVCAPVSQ